MTEFDDIYNKLIKMNLPREERFLIMLLLCNGLRVSEICENMEIIPTDSLRCNVYQVKTKTYRVASVFYENNLAKELSEKYKKIEWYRNRWYYYRIFKRLGISQTLENRTNASVTHLARHTIARSMASHQADKEAIKSQLGHRSIKSQESYTGRKATGLKQKGGILNSPSGQENKLVITKRGVIYMKHS